MHVQYYLILLDIYLICYRASLSTMTNGMLHLYQIIKFAIFLKSLLTILRISLAVWKAQRSTKHIYLYIYKCKNTCMKNWLPMSHFIFIWRWAIISKPGDYKVCILLFMSCLWSQNMHSYCHIISAAPFLLYGSAPHTIQKPRNGRSPGCSALSEKSSIMMRPADQASLAKLYWAPWKFSF